MPDWIELVRQHLADLSLEGGETTQVFEELADHLEEEYVYLLKEGVSEQDAANRVQLQIRDWRELRQMIESARNQETVVPKRVAQFWLPAFLTLSLSMVCLALIQAFGPNPWVSPLPGGRLHMTPVAVVYLPWLLALPLIGALGSYLSLTAGGSKRVVFSAMAFPVLPYLVFFIVGFPLALILDDQVAHNIMIPAFFAGLFAWVILPGAALLTGGWPVQYCASRRLNPIDSADS